jgi:nucleotide-binding universal stress UspA family protein
MDTAFRILMATDYSDDVQNAERYAYQLGASIQASIVFLHVYDSSLAIPLFVPEFYNAGNAQEELELLRTHVSAIEASLALKKGDVTSDCVVREGVAGEEICAEAIETQANFIIAGKHGHTGIRKYFPGSHTWDVIRNASCPVLVIPPDGYFTGIKQITYVTEYREGEISAIRFLAGLAECFGAGLVILHVGNRSLSREFENMLFEKFREELRQKLGSTKPDIRLLQGENVVTSINEFCLRTETDWLAISPGKSTLYSQLFSSSLVLTRQMSFYTRLPLLSIPDDYQAEKTGLWSVLEHPDEERKNISERTQKWTLK